MEHHPAELARVTRPPWSPVFLRLIPWAPGLTEWEKLGAPCQSLYLGHPGAVTGWGHPWVGTEGEAGMERPEKCWQGVSGAIPRQTQLPRGQGLHAAWPPTNINHFLIYNMNN